MKKHPLNPPPANLPPKSSSSSRDNDSGLPYRSGVGIVLINREGEVLIAERLDYPGSWQMPQGGIDEGETPEIAVFREMEEEIGTRNAEIIDVMEEWIYYDFPVVTANKLWGGKFRGQRQKWVALRFLGEDADISLDRHAEPEFGRWQWVPMESLLNYAVPFKRSVYERVMEAFFKYAIRDL